jgi:hypothetical protein
LPTPTTAPSTSGSEGSSGSTESELGYACGGCNGDDGAIPIPMKRDAGSGAKDATKVSSAAGGARVRGRGGSGASGLLFAALALVGVAGHSRRRRR